MVTVIIQLLIISLWAATLVANMRRLFRLAQIQVLHVWQNNNDKLFSQKLHRVWWWLGREEFWRKVQIDGLYCTQLTLMLFLMVWGIYS
jgi:hypothetical protein